MRVGSDELKQVLLKGSFSQRFSCDIFYGATRTQSGLPIEKPSVKWNADATIEGSAQVTVIHAPIQGESLTPALSTDVLAPFGPHAIVYVEILAKDFREVVQVGRYRIVSVPSSRDEFIDFMGQKLVSGSVIELSLLDLSVGITRWGFRVPEVPPSLNSCFAEMGRITGATIVRSVSDLPLPASVVYEANRGGRWKAVQEIAGVLGGRARFDSFGALTIVPDAPDPVSTRLVLGKFGTILTVGSAMESDEVYNEVVGNFEDDDRNPIYEVAAIESGPLSIYGEFGRNTYYVASPLVKDPIAAYRFVNTRLASLSSALSYRVTVDCILNPLIETGDTVSVEQQPGTITGRVVSISFGDDGQMRVELEVSRVL